MNTVKNIHKFLVSEPEISVLMSCYNSGRWLSEAIDSILSQTFKNFEFIIVNDGSDDNTQEILNCYSKKDSRIQIVNQSRSGVTVALNNGLRLCKGEWVFRMDSDDVAIANRFTLQLQEAKKKKDLILIGGFCEQIDDKGISLKCNKYPLNHQALVKDLLSLRPFLPHSSVCFKRDAVNRIGGYRDRFKRAQDVDLWMRLAETGKFGCVNSIIIKLRNHNLNISNMYFKEQRVFGICALVCYFRRRFNFIDPSSSDEKSWLKFRYWVESELEKMGYFKEIEAYSEIKNLIFRNSGMLRFKEYIKLIVNTKTLLLLVEYVYRRIFGKVAFNLAIRSKDLLR